VNNLLKANGIAALRPKQKEYSVSDGGGLWIKVFPDKNLPRTRTVDLSDAPALMAKAKPRKKVKPGRKVFYFHYQRPIKVEKGKRPPSTNITLGDLETMTLAEAREIAVDYRRKLAKGIDPQLENAKQQAEALQSQQNTLKFVFDEWLNEQQTNKAFSLETGKDITRMLEIHVFPTLGEMPIDEIRARNVKEVLKKPRNRGNLETVKRCSRNLDRIFKWALRNDYCTVNNIAGIAEDFPAPQPVTNPKLKPDEIPDFMLALSRTNTDITIRYCIESSLHLMTRPKELAHARWDEIDFKARTITIPATRMKGQSRKAESEQQDHVIPLSKQMMRIFRELSKFTGDSEFLFPSNIKIGQAINSQSCNVAIKRMAMYTNGERVIDEDNKPVTYKGKLTSHGLRGTASTALNNELDEDYDVVENALSHKTGSKISQSYDAGTKLPQRVKLMQRWSDFIEQAANGNSLAKSPLKAVK
jgi:integrase